MGLKRYEVWAGGARLNEGSYPPRCLGTIEALSFAEACEKLRDREREAAAGPYSFKEDREKADEAAKLWDIDRLTWWGCTLFEDKKTAWHCYVENYL